MRDAGLMMGVVFYGGEGAKPEPAKPKPEEKPADKPADVKEPGETPPAKT